MRMVTHPTLSALVSATTGEPFAVESITTISAGARWHTLQVDNRRTGNPEHVFAKSGATELQPVFAAEQDGLERLQAAATDLRIPVVLYCGTPEDTALLLLEWIDLQPLDAASGRALGVAMAGLHRVTSNQYGYEQDNFIGATPQRNQREDDWVTFWQHHRLLPQLHLAACNRYPSQLLNRGERLVADCGAFFACHRPVASLLHGDAWGGNVAADNTGKPVLFDPAVYFGDREADLAMTELFGGFPKDFHAAYHNAWPLDADYTVRRNFYNLYHVLNHANLFAGDYVRQSEHLIEVLLAEL